MSELSHAEFVAEVYSELDTLDRYAQANFDMLLEDLQPHQLQELLRAMTVTP